MERVAVAARVSSALQVLVSDDLDGYLLSRRAVGRLATSLCCPMRWFGALVRCKARDCKRATPCAPKNSQNIPSRSGHRNVESNVDISDSVNC